MFSKLFSRNIKKVDEGVFLPPNRFSFMSKDEQLQFQDDIVRYFQNKPEYKIDFPQGAIIGPADNQYGLDNLAQNYHHAGKYEQADSKKKSEIISEHFNGIFQRNQENGIILKNRANYNLIKKYISVRLYPPDYLNTVGENRLIYRKDLEDVLTVLVFDLPSSISFVQPEDMAKWKIKEDDLFTLGFKNTYANNKVEVVEHEFADKNSLWQIGSDNLFGATFAYNLSKYPKTHGKYGSLVSVPHRHALLVVPINDLSIIKALNQFIIITNGMFKEGPGSISPHIFWYHDDKFFNLPYKLDDKVSFYPPESFIEMLNKLPEAKT